MNKSSIVFAAVLASALQGYSYDWSQHAAGDTVTLSESAEVLDADLGVVTNLAGIVLDDAAADLVFNNATIAATMNGTITGAGRIVKRGAANVFFGKPHTTDTTTSPWGKGPYQDNYTAGGIAVETGDLYLPQDGKASCCYGPVTLAANTTLHVHPDSETCLRALNGSGKVSNGNTWTCWDNPDHQVNLFIGYYGARDISDFSGAFEGNFSCVMCGNVRISSADTCRAAMNVSVYRNAFDSKEIGVLRVGKFGKRPPSSYRYYGPDDKDLSAFASPLGIGTSYYYGVDYDINYGGHLIYTGSGETTDRIFRFGGTYCPEYGELDAGATGGVKFTGEFRTYGSDKYYGAILSGSNTVPMTVAGSVGGGNGRIHYIKSGTGTWNWEPTSCGDLAGAFFIVNGTLTFPTIANIGAKCAFGTATNCWKSTKYAGLPAYWEDPANKLDCEMVLGDWDKGGTKFPTLAYTGSSVASSNRRIGLIGVGGTIANTNAAGALKLTGGVSPRTLKQVMESSDTTVRAKTLCLDAAGAGNAVGPIAENAAGTINLVKTGAGTWSIRDNFAIHGDIDVREGVLSFEQKGLTPYTWFRYTVTQLNSANDNGNAQYLWQKQLGLFDKDGNRLSQNYTFVGPDVSVYTTWHHYAGNYDWTALQPGQVTMGEYARVKSGISINSEGNAPHKLFQDSTSYLRATLSYLSKISAPDYYFPIVFRLPEGSAPVKYFDIVQYSACSAGNHVAAFTFEGSDNGVDWVLLHNQTECTHASGTQWFSTGTTVTNGVNQNCIDGHFGYAIDTERAAAEKETLDLSTANSIRVAPGATLKVATEGVVALPKLTVDCAGSGVATVKGFAIPATGTLTLQNAPKGPFDLPVGFVNCSDLANLANWTVANESGVLSRTKLEVVDGQVKVVRQGLSLLVK